MTKRSTAPARGINVPAGKAITPIKPGTKQEILVNLLRKGATMAALMKATGWTRASVSGGLHGDLRRHGFGVSTEGDKLFLVEPKRRKR